MTTEEAVKIGDLVIDDETGEILEMPEGIGDPLEWLTHRANEANAAANAWKGVAGMYRTAIGGLLTKAGVKSMRTQYGTPGWRSRVTRTGRPERLNEIVGTYELTHGQAHAILGCASALDARKLDGLPDEILPPEAKRELIDENEATWVQITPATPAPPDIETVQRKREGP